MKHIVDVVSSFFSAIHVFLQKMSFGNMRLNLSKIFLIFCYRHVFVGRRVWLLFKNLCSLINSYLCNGLNTRFSGESLYDYALPPNMEMWFCGCVWGRCHAPDIFEISRKLVKQSTMRQASWSEISVTLFIVTAVGQSVKRPPPPMESVSTYLHTDLLAKYLLPKLRATTGITVAREYRYPKFMNTIYFLRLKRNDASCFCEYFLTRRWINAKNAVVDIRWARGQSAPQSAIVSAISREL